MKIIHKKCGNVVNLPEGMGIYNNIYCDECETVVPRYVSIEEWKEVT